MNQYTFSHDKTVNRRWHFSAMISIRVQDFELDSLDKPTSRIDSVPVHRDTWKKWNAKTFYGALPVSGAIRLLKLWIKKIKQTTRRLYCTCMTFTFSFSFFFFFILLSVHAVIRRRFVGGKTTIRSKQYDNVTTAIRDWLLYGHMLLYCENKTYHIHTIRVRTCSAQSHVVVASAYQPRTAHNNETSRRGHTARMRE